MEYGAGEGMYLCVGRRIGITSGMMCFFLKLRIGSFGKYGDRME